MSLYYYAMIQKLNNMNDKSLLDMFDKLEVEAVARISILSAHYLSKKNKENSDGK